MSTSSKIEWTNSTWNPVTGCSKISPGCANCYAEKYAVRLKAMGQPNYANGFKLTLHEDMLERPLKWKKRGMVFVNSMSDLFHDDVPSEFIQKVFEVAIKTPHLRRFQILTKRSRRLLQMNHDLTWPDNIWMGVSVENIDYVFRIDDLKKTKAKTKFISFEPLIGSVGAVCLKGIDWVIVGGESGPRSRPMLEEWVANIRDQCLGVGVPFFFKQWGGRNKKKSGRVLNGRTWDEIPDL